MKFSILFSLLCVGGLAGAWSLSESRQEQEGQPLPAKRSFMQMKVEHAKEILQGLATEDFDAITKNANDLLVISNQSNWNAFQTPEYIELSRDFRIVAERLRETSREKQIDGATLGYIELTMSCVRCHKYLREKTQSR